MRVIHGVWAHGLSNTGALPVGRGPGPAATARGRRRRRAPARPHPFACQAAELADMLAGSPPGSASTAAGDAVRKAVHDELTLQLPSAGGGPLASPELVRPEAPADSRCARRVGAPAAPAAPVPARRGRVSLAGWRVPVLALGPGAALALLGGSGLERLRAVRRRRDGRRVADLPGRGGAVRGRPGRPRPGAARARVRGRRLTRHGGGRCSAVPTRSAPVTWPRPCPRPAGPSPATHRERCSAAPWMPWPTRPRGPG